MTVYFQETQLYLLFCHVANGTETESTINYTHITINHKIK